MKKTGSVLVVAVIIMVLLASAVALVVMLTFSQSQQVTKSTESYQLHQIAMAGLEMARRVLLVGHDNGWNDELADSANKQTTYNPNDPPIVAGTSEALFQWARDIDYNKGRYWVSVFDNNDGDGNTLVDSDDKVQLRVRGFFSGVPEERVYLVLVRYRPPLYEPEAAIVSGGDMKISGNPTISGTMGTIMVDGNLEISGNAYISQDVLAAGDVDISGNPHIGGATVEFGPRPDIPPITPSDYYSYRDLRLGADGKVYNLIETAIWDTVASGEYEGWKYQDGAWKFSGNSGTSGKTYYIQGDVEISGNPGSEASPWRTTLITTGYLKISGNPVVAPDQPGTLFIVGTDIKITGNNFQQTEPALLAAHEQVAISGTSEYLGSILAEDAEDVCGLVSTASELTMSMSGNPFLVYNGAMQTIIRSGDPGVVILAIKQEKK